MTRKFGGLGGIAALALAFPLVYVGLSGCSNERPIRPIQPIIQPIPIAADRGEHTVIALDLRLTNTGLVTLEGLKPDKSYGVTSSVKTTQYNKDRMYRWKMLTPDGGVIHQGDFDAKFMAFFGRNAVETSKDYERLLLPCSKQEDARKIIIYKISGIGEEELKLEVDIPISEK